MPLNQRMPVSSCLKKNACLVFSTGDFRIHICFIEQGAVRLMLCFGGLQMNNDQTLELVQILPSSVQN